MHVGYYILHFPYQDYSKYRRYIEHYDHGGSQNVAYNLATNIAKREHNVKIFTTSMDSKDSIERHKSMMIYHYGTNFKIGHANISFEMFRKHLNLKYQLDIIHAHTMSVAIAGLAAMRHAKRKDIPLVVTYHGDAKENQGSFARRMGVLLTNKYLIDKVLSYATLIISPSEYCINESKFLLKYKDKISVIPNGINIEDFEIPYSKERCREELDLPLSENIILFVGVLEPHKGPDVLIKAMPEIIKEVPETKLVLMGSGMLKEKLEKLSKKLGIGKHIKFAGFIGNPFIKALYYKAADVFVLPATGPEIFGIVNLEAMACGVPIVATKIGGIPDVVKGGVNGLLVPPRASDALADAIIYLLQNEDVRVKMGKNGRKKVEDYSWERIAEETERVYEDCL
jgi:glycosyltransferase involved in cell wall biosynthesis